MADLTTKTCKPCEGGVSTLDPGAAEKLLRQVDGWRIGESGKYIYKEYSFKGFYRTMAFVNAIAWIANREGHHPDLEVGYGRCLVRYSTHAVDGLTENDFICAAHIDTLGG